MATSVFTLEQLDLVRRLKVSGLCKDEVMAAFDSFDLCDRELGSTYNITLSLALQIQNMQMMVLNNNNNNNINSNKNNNNTLSHNNNNINSISLHNNISSHNNIAMVNSVDNINDNKVGVSGIQTNLANNNRQEANITTTNQQAAVILNSNNNIIKNINNAVVTSTNTNDNDNNNCMSLNNNNKMNGGDSTTTTLLDMSNNNDLEVDNNEFIEFIKQGEVVCCEKIRLFATKHNIKQQQIATLAGICQSYVSRYMKGDIYDMSERSRRSIQKWFLVYRRNPASIAYAVNAAQHLINLSSSKRLSCLDQLDFTADSAFPRRERFVFRAGHLEILERYFQDNNYPSYETREHIAQSCNVVTQNTAGRELTEREKVTTQIISNWFANKRKELKKLAKEEGLMDISTVPVRPRGHPSRVYSDLISHSRHSDPPYPSTSPSITPSNTPLNAPTNTTLNTNSNTTAASGNSFNPTATTTTISNDPSHLNGHYLSSCVQFGEENGGVGGKGE